MEGPDEGEVHSGWSIDGDWGIDGMNEGQNLSDSVCMGTEKGQSWEGWVRLWRTLSIKVRTP